MIIKKVEHESIIWGIWKIDENIDILKCLLNDVTFCSNISSEKRLKEQLSVRVLLKTLLNEEKKIEYHPNGKPYLSDRSFHISISHTKGYATVILSKTSRVGIDIEHISEKVKRVKDRFISENEYIENNNETIHLLLHWSAKETLYKVIGETGIDFKQDLFINEFSPKKSGFFTAVEKYTEKSDAFTIEYFVEDDYVLTLTY